MRLAPMSALAASAVGRSRAKDEDRLLNFDLAPDKKPVEERPPTPPATHMRAAILAPRFRLDQREVVRILKAFGNTRGEIKAEDFHKILREIFDVPEVKKETLLSAYEASDCSEGVDVNKFLTWYVQNMFAHVSALEASPKSLKGNDRMQQLAREHQVQISTVDRAKRLFDRFDRDGSEGLDFEEFLDAIPEIFKARPTDIAEKRIRHFFAEADRNNNGVVDFSEFAAWYLRAFNPEILEVGTGPEVAIYASYRPCIQRKCMLERRRSI